MHFSLLALLPVIVAQQIPLTSDFQEQFPFSLPARPNVKPVPIPHIGFGTWNLKVSAQNTTDAVAAAIEAGYRHIDCASGYANQVDVGRGIKEGLMRVHGLKRSDLWVTSKLWNDAHAPDNVEAALDDTLSDLGLDYLDLYLMHWPVGNTGPDGKLEFDYISTWQAMEALPLTNKTKHIGVSNFNAHQLYQLIGNATISPAVHQMELHPYLQQTWWLAQHKAHGIAVTAYSPLGDTNPTYHDSSPSFSPSSASEEYHGEVEGEVEEAPRLLDNPVLKSIAARRNCTVPQVALSWGQQRGVAVIPKSSHVKWIKENLASTDCELGILDLAEIKGVGVKYLHRFNNPSKGWGVKLFKGLDGVDYDD